MGKEAQRAFMRRDLETVFVATVDTRYQVIAVAKTREKARRLALRRALEELQSVNAPGWKSSTLDSVEMYFGVNVTEVPLNSAVVVS